jgi:TPR repeat protein
MKRYLKVLLALFLNINLMADNADDGLQALKNKDYIKAEKLWEQACNDGNTKGCFHLSNLGILYKNGEGVKQDYNKAKNLWEIACENQDYGGGGGCYNLGRMYDMGESVEPDFKKAVQYYKKACERENSTGCHKYEAMILILNKKLEQYADDIANKKYKQ